MVKGIFPSHTWFLVAASLWLAGCAGSQAARFYTLNPTVSQQARQQLGEAGHPVSLGVAPVEIPDYLDRPQMMTREGDNQMKLAEFHRWAGSLGDNMTSVLAENLAALLGSDQVFLQPRQGTRQLDYALALRVLGLDLIPGKEVQLRVQWAIASLQQKQEATSHLASFSEPLSDSRYEAMAAAVSRALAQASREIAREIAQRPKGAASGQSLQ